MNKFWKRANRGLILGGVLILGVVVYEIIDYSRFVNGQDEMESVLSGYITDLGNASIATGDLAEYGHEKTEEEKAALYQKLSSVIKTYWTDTHEDSYNTYKKDLLLSVYEVAYDTDYPGYVTDYSFNLSQLSFSKNGPNAALFSVEMQLVVDTYGSCMFATPTDYDSSYYSSSSDTEDDLYEDYVEIIVDDDDDTDDDSDESEIAYYEGNLRTTGTVTLFGELLYEDGGWKISYIDSDYSGFNAAYTTTIHEGSDD